MTSERNRRKGHWDTITAGCSVVIAACALIATLLQADWTREHNRLSVRPFLNIYHQGERDGREVGWIVENTGLGPAIIASSEIWLNGTRIGKGISYSAWEEVAEDLGLPPETVSITGLDRLEVVANGAEYPLLALNDDPKVEWGKYDLEFETVAHNLFKRVDMVVCYCSFYAQIGYRECWREDAENRGRELHCEKSPKLDRSK